MPSEPSSAWPTERRSPAALTLPLSRARERGRVRAARREDREERAWRLLTRDVGSFSAYALRRPLRAYQLEAARAIAASVLEERGLTFTVVFPRQAGKNELSAHLPAPGRQFDLAPGAATGRALDGHPLAPGAGLHLPPRAGVVLLLLRPADRQRRRRDGQPAARGGRGPGPRPAEVGQGPLADGRQRGGHASPLRDPLDRRHPPGRPGPAQPRA